MLDILKNRPSIVLEAQKARFRPGVVIQLLVFAAVLIVTQIAASLPVLIYVVVKVISDISGGRIDLGEGPPISLDYFSELAGGDRINLIMLFSTVITIFLVIIYCRFIEGRSLYSMGFGKKNAVYEYASGLLTGAVMFSSAVLLCWLTGTLEFNGVIVGNSLGLVIIFFIAFLFQGMSEEVLLRGYLMISVAAKKPIIAAILLNSVIFALMHLANNGITLLPVINLVLYGIFASVYTLKSDNLWGTCAIHSVWNFAQGNIYGIAVSGIQINASVLSFTPTESNTIINGGSFGLEGGLAVTIVLLAATALTLLLKGRAGAFKS